MRILIALLFAMTEAWAASPPPAAAPALALLAEAERMFAHGDNLRALSLYQALLEQDRNNPRAWLRVGELYRREGKLEQSLQAYAEVKRIYPGADTAPEAAEVLALAHLARAQVYATFAELELASARDLPAPEAVQDEIARSERALVAMRPATQRGRASASGRTVEVHHPDATSAPVAAPVRSSIPVIRGGADRRSANPSGDSP